VKPNIRLSTAILLATASALPAQQAPATIDTTAAAPRIRELVAAIAAADSIDGRREAIVARLRAMGLEPTLAAFDPPAEAQAGRRGTNVIARIGGRATSTILLGAHYDRVPRGRGVIDNAAGVAAVLELAEAFAKQPLANYTVEVALWDLEERGLLGSRARVADSLQAPLPQIYVNFDIFGYGDSFMIGAMNGDAPFVQRMQAAAREAAAPITVDTLYPPSDHLSFRPTSTQSYAVSILSGDDITKVLGMLRSGAPPSGEVAPIFRILHSDADSMDKLDAAAVARGVRVVEAAIRALDAGPPARPQSR
jgi:Zn-dependent M28 family amino/carboxypeptidase